MKIARIYLRVSTDEQDLTRQADIEQSTRGALGLVLNMIVLWNTIYMEVALNQLRAEGYPVEDADVVRLSPLLHEHINMLGRYFFSIPEAVAKGYLRPLRDPNDDNQG